MELYVISGNLSHKGQITSYEYLAEILTGLSIPYRVMVGNHAIRANLLSVLADVPTDPNEFIQSSVDHDFRRLSFLDTVAEGKKFGCFCEDRAEWLADKLAASGDRPVYLFLHHPPPDIGVPNVDHMRLIHGNELLARTRVPYNNVQHMFFDRVHRPTAGNWNGISFSSRHGTAHQVALTSTETPLLVSSHEPPVYGADHGRHNDTVSRSPA